MYPLTKFFAEKLMLEWIDRDLAVFNQDLRRNIAFWYAHMAGYVPGDIQTALASFSGTSERRAALEAYKSGLTSDAWINLKNTQDTSGDWVNRDWELFHHWIKLAALGAEKEEIAQVISIAKTKGLPIPQTLDADQWHLWSHWMPVDVSAADIPEATIPILRTHTFDGVKLREYFGYQFLGEGQPGYKYKREPPSSCFGPGALVVMADGSLKPIENVCAGDQVKTPDGKRSVLLLAAPKRGNRQLYNMKGYNFGFTASHPFMIFDGKPETSGVYAAVKPVDLLRVVPTLAQFGITALHQKPKLTRHTKTGSAPVTAGPINLVEGKLPDTVYDLYLDLGEDGRSEYFAGDSRAQFLTSSEIPRYLAAPAAAAAILHVLKETALNIVSALEDVPDEVFAGALQMTLASFAPGMMAEIGPKLNALTSRILTDDETSAQDSGELLAGITSFAGAFADDAGHYNQRLGLLYDMFVAQFGSVFHATIQLGWRSFDLADLQGATILAVSVYGLELSGRDLGIPANEADIGVELSRGAASYERVVPVLPSASTNHSYYTADQIVYFPEWRNTLAPAGGASLEWQISVTLLSRKSGERVPWKASVPLPQEIDFGYESFSSFAVDRSGEVIGQVAFDARALNVGGYAADIEAKKKWRPVHEQLVAQWLAELCIEFINANLDNAVVAGLTLAGINKARAN